jgi:DNA-binding NtrC family response regulator
MPTPPTVQHSPRSSDDRLCVLVLEDTRSYRRALQQALSRECDLRVLEADDGLHALRLLEQHPEIVAVVADDRLPVGPPGMAVLETIGRRWPGKGRLLLSAWTTGAMVAAGAEAGYDVLDKSIDWPTIVFSICSVARRCQRCDQPRGQCICEIGRKP